MIYPGGQLTADLLRQAAEDSPSTLFLVGEDGYSLTYAEALDRAGRLAAGLEDMGVRRGDAVMVVLGSGVEYPLTLFALHALGAMSVNVNTLYTQDELQYLHDECQPRIVICDVGLAPLMRRVRGAAPLVVVGATQSGETDWAGLCDRPGVDLRPRPGVSTDDAATVIYTSGTTSRPKGVILRQGSHGFAGQYLARNIGLREAERYYCILPMFHSNALQNGLFPMLAVRGTVYLRKFSASRFTDDVLELGITYTSGGAPHWRMVLAQLEKEGRIRAKGSKLRLALSGMPMSDAEYAGFEALFGCRIVEIFGLTEGVVPTTLQPPYGRRKRRTGGLPGLGSELRIVKEDGSLATPGETGEIQTRTHGAGGLTLGYLKQPEETAKLFTDDGWLRTFDLGYQDEDCHLNFVSRIKDMIKVGGENVSASEVERVLGEHPAILEAAAIGLPDPVLGHVVGAFYVAQPGADVDLADIIRFCEARLAKFKVPRKLAPIDALPRNALNKVVKAGLPAL